MEEGTPHPATAATNLDAERDAMALLDLRGQRGQERPARFTARHARDLGPERELGAAAPGELGE